MPTLPDYCVLMSVYYKEKAEYLRAAIESMLSQSIPPKQFVLVCDGKLSVELDNVVFDFESKYPSLIDVIRLSENHGLAYALNVGIAHCKYEYIARMDSDDISLPNRIQLQLSAMQDSHADICSGTLKEFKHNCKDITAIKTLPLNHTDIIKYSKRRNPFHHPCVMYKKSAVISAGKYEPFAFFEDYQLWIRMLSNGCKGINISEPILLMRTGNGMYTRRGGLKYFSYAKKMERYKLQNGYTSYFEYIQVIIIKFFFCIIPVSVREKLYRLLLRRKVS